MFDYPKPNDNFDSPTSISEKDLRCLSVYTALPLLNQFSVKF